MKFTAVIIALACAEAALGARFTEARRQRHAERAAAKREATRNSNPRLPADDSITQGLAFDNETQVSYSSNWAGAVLIGSAIPTGVDFYVEGSTVSYDAWYEWYPDYAYTFSGITISAGDTITVTVTASSTTGGTAVVANKSTGKSVTHTFSGQSKALQELNAEWIVEDFSSGSSLVPFADFGKVTFTGASATTSSGTVGVSGAEIIDIKQSNKVLTDVSLDSSSQVTVTYVG
ncbi:hypothetical protein LQW54_011168 [Pestalotiopsis sp. IQ-011]